MIIEHTKIGYRVSYLGVSVLSKTVEQGINRVLNVLYFQNRISEVDFISLKA